MLLYWLAAAVAKALTILWFIELKIDSNVDYGRYIIHYGGFFWTEHGASNATTMVFEEFLKFHIEKMG
jgi:hypothetical protein